jgi:hypothetical protein
VAWAGLVSVAFLALASPASPPPAEEAIADALNACVGSARAAMIDYRALTANKPALSDDDPFARAALPGVYVQWPSTGRVALGAGPTTCSVTASGSGTLDALDAVLGHLRRKQLYVEVDAGMAARFAKGEARTRSFRHDLGLRDAGTLRQRAFIRFESSDGRPWLISWVQLTDLVRPADPEIRAVLIPADLKVD